MWPLGQRNAERAIVFNCCATTMTSRWSRAELAVELADLERSAVAAAIRRLQEAGVVLDEGEAVLTTPAARRLDALGVIGP